MEILWESLKQGKQMNQYKQTKMHILLHITLEEKVGVCVVEGTFIFSKSDRWRRNECAYVYCDICVHVCKCALNYSWESWISGSE